MAEGESKSPSYKDLQAEKTKLELRDSLKKEIPDQYKSKPDFTNAPPKTRLNIADKWIKRAFDAKNDNKEYPSQREKIYKSLGINATPDKIADTDQESIIQRIRDFQKANGLEADGIIGPRTLEKLDKVSDGFKKTVEIKDSKENIYEPYSVPPETPAVAPDITKDTTKAAPSETKKEKTEAEKKNEELDRVEDDKIKKQEELQKAQKENPGKHADFNKKYDEQREAYKKKDASEKSVKETE